MSNKQSLFHDIEKINNIIAAANNHFLYICIPQGYKVKTLVCTFISVTVVIIRTPGLSMMSGQ